MELMTSLSINFSSFPQYVDTFKGVSSHHRRFFVCHCSSNPGASGLPSSITLKTSYGRRKLLEEDRALQGDASRSIFQRNSSSTDDEAVSTRVLMRRSRLLAKQVICIRSAMIIGFISQIWVDTAAWVALLIEVRPNLLSGESERFLLKDISRVGDVVLIEDENVIERELPMVALDTLVGYRVIASDGQLIGKVRGYSFDIESGAVESIELDSFGLSIIPSSLVTTYSLLVEDVTEVVADTVVVYEAAALRLQKLTKGLLGNKQFLNSMDEEDDSDDDTANEQVPRLIPRRKIGRRLRTTRIKDDWELPMDFL